MTSKRALQIGVSEVMRPKPDERTVREAPALHGMWTAAAGEQEEEVTRDDRAARILQPEIHRRRAQQRTRARRADLDALARVVVVAHQRGERAAGERGGTLEAERGGSSEPIGTEVLQQGAVAALVSRVPGVKGGSAAVVGISREIDRRSGHDECLDVERVRPPAEPRRDIEVPHDRIDGQTRVSCIGGRIGVAAVELTRIDGCSIGGDRIRASAVERRSVGRIALTATTGRREDQEAEDGEPLSAHRTCVPRRAGAEAESFSAPYSRGDYRRSCNLGAKFVGSVSRARRLRWGGS